MIIETQEQARQTRHVEGVSFRCSDCGEVKPVHHGRITTGYGYDEYDNIVCFECCGKRDAATMRETGKATLYLTSDKGEYFVSNWPSTLKLSAYVRRGRHNIAGKRYDAWFWFENTKWYGVTYGDNTQICHCKRLKHAD